MMSTGVTRVVSGDPMLYGAFQTVADAVDASKEGDTVVVMPGTYSGEVEITLPNISILGMDAAGEFAQKTVLTSSGDATISYNMDGPGLIAGITVSQSSAGCGLLIAKGNPDVQNCEFSSKGSAPCIVVMGELAKPTVKFNLIQSCLGGGVVFCNKAEGVFEENKVCYNHKAGLNIATKANPVVRRNHIFSGHAGGVLIFDGGLGQLKENEIYGELCCCKFNQQRFSPHPP